MALPGSESLVAGQYTVTWNSLALGIHEGDDGSPAITWQDKAKRVNNTDKYGYATITSLKMGVDYQFEGTLMEWSKALALLNGYFGTFGLQGQPGIYTDTLAQALVLTAVAGTSAAAAPATLTASKAVLAAEHQGKIMFGPQTRVVPIKMDLLCYITTGSTVGNFVMT